jgi:hypothetical protein
LDWLGGSLALPIPTRSPGCKLGFGEDALEKTVSEALDLGGDPGGFNEVEANAEYAGLVCHGDGILHRPGANAKMPGRTGM